MYVAGPHAAQNLKKVGVGGGGAVEAGASQFVMSYMCTLLLHVQLSSIYERILFVKQ